MSNDAYASGPRDARERAQPIVKSLLITAFITFLVVLFLVDGPVRTFINAVGVPDRAAPTTEVIVRTVLICAAVSIFIGTYRQDRRAARARRARIAAEANVVGRVAPSEDGENSNDVLEQVFAAATYAPQRYFDEAIGLFCSMLVDEGYRTRIVERVSLQQNKAVKRTRFELSISADEKEAVLVRAASALRPLDSSDSANSSGLSANDSSITASDAPRPVQDPEAEFAPIAGSAVGAPGRPGTGQSSSARSTPWIANGEISGDAATLPDTEQATAAPVPRSAVLIVPLMLVRKGTLLSSLEIRNNDGARLSELTQEETRGLTAIALSSYFELTFRDVRASPNSSQDEIEERYIPIADTCLWSLRSIALRLEPMARAEAEKLFDSAVLPLMDRVQDKASLNNLKKLCLFFANSYFMACEVPLPSGFIISIESETDFSIFDPPTSWQRRLRSFFGMEPTRYSVDLDMAHHTRNYHAELEGADRLQYVHRHHVFDHDADREVTAEHFAAGKSGLVIYRSDPDRVAPRVNIRNLSTAAQPHLSWEIFVAEVPPGTLAPVLSLSLAATILSFCFAFIVPSINSTEFDAPALVVAIPLFVVTFFGFSFDKMTRSSLAGVFLFIASSVLIVISATLVLESTAESAWTVHHPSLLGFWRIADFNSALIGCGLLQLIISLTLGFLIHRRVQRYRTVTLHNYSRVQTKAKTGNHE